VSQECNKRTENKGHTHPACHGGCGGSCDSSCVDDDGGNSSGGGDTLSLFRRGRRCSAIGKTRKLFLVRSRLVSPVNASIPGKEL
jgi:hypothetical protein